MTELETKLLSNALDLMRENLKTIEGYKHTTESFYDQTHYLGYEIGINNCIGIFEHTLEQIRIMES